jgi:hypothetical protein
MPETVNGPEDVSGWDVAHMRELGHAVDITARIEHRRILSGLISEYRRAA